MKVNFINTFILLAIASFLTNCVSQRTSTITGGNYNETKNETDYFVIPYGSVTLPGHWEKTSYNSISRQQFLEIKIQLLLQFHLVDLISMSLI